MKNVKATKRLSECRFWNCRLSMITEQRSALRCFRIEKLEMSVKALSADLSAKSLVNQELSSKLSGVTSSERQMKQELEQMRSDKRGLEERITDLSSQKVSRLNYFKLQCIYFHSFFILNALPNSC